MKTILLGFILLCSFKGKAQSDTTGTGDTVSLGVYQYAVTDVNGTDHSLLDFKGEKIWLVILPSTQSSSDSSFLVRIDSIALADRDSLKTIAVPSFEDGYTADSLNTLINWYSANLDSSVIISQPLYTHISSDTAQAGLFHWLTHSVSNGHYDTEVSGTGSMFFIDEQGFLNGVFNSDTRWSNKALNLMFN